MRNVIAAIFAESSIKSFLGRLNGNKVLQSAKVHEIRSKLLLSNDAGNKTCCDN